MLVAVAFVTDIVDVTAGEGIVTIASCCSLEETLAIAAVRQFVEVVVPFLLLHLFLLKFHRKVLLMLHSKVL